jgi:hypothetical protein
MMMVTGWTGGLHAPAQITFRFLYLFTAFTATASFLLSQQSLLTGLNFSKIQYDLRSSIILIPGSLMFPRFIVVHKGVTSRRSLALRALSSLPPLV